MEIAAQLLAEEMPGRALVLHPAVERRNGDRLAAPRPQLDRSPHGRDRRIRSAFREGPADLQLRAHAFPEPAIELEQQRVAVLDGSGVMLLPVQARLSRRQAGARRRHQQPGRRPAAGAGANRLEERSRGGGVGERIDQLQLRAVAAAQDGDHRLGGSGLLLRLQRQGKDVLLRLALAEFHLQHGETQRVDRNDVLDPHLRDFPRAAVEPAAALEPRRQHHLERGPLPTGERALPAARDFEQRWLVRGLARVLRGGLGLF